MINNTAFIILDAVLIKLEELDIYMLVLKLFQRLSLEECTYSTILTRIGDRTYEFKRGEQKYKVFISEDGSNFEIVKEEQSC